MKAVCIAVPSIFMEATPDEDISSTFGLCAATFPYGKDFPHPALPVDPLSAKLKDWPLKG